MMDSAAIIPAERLVNMREAREKQRRWQRAIRNSILELVEDPHLAYGLHFRRLWGVWA
jgi:hypothetical protein